MKQRLAAYTAALNRYDLDAVESMFAENAIYSSSGFHNALHGRVAIMTEFRGYFAEHTDQVNEDTHVRINGANVVQSDWSFTATKSNTGEKISRKGTQVMTFSDQGRIALIQVFDF